MSPKVVLLIVGGCAGLALLVWLSLWSRVQALRALHQWAKGQGLELVHATRRSFVPLWQFGKGCQFFRVTVRNSGGGVDRAWIRCPDFNSAEPHNLEVMWDDEPES
jgi:hypothetical protein